MIPFITTITRENCSLCYSSDQAIEGSSLQIRNSKGQVLLKEHSQDQAPLCVSVSGPLCMCLW